ncbi:hypothetical protein [Bifidobacterium sp. ESL0745]|uniref:hypothetical protein n=1 Tax=Bifidobacterium sp. ESL0745 TaxID=2983226 RepID=UPI0023F8E69A|nr:hypothetical protein [Bifidobacterium sp. ESL0745]MDF7665709.1 hypothetical protein [Bifidobacterium sp. ESL0745]
MSVAKKSWLCACGDEWDEGMVIQAPTRGAAKARYVDEGGSDEFTAVRTRRLKWMDGFDPDSYDAQMAAMRHGWTGYTVRRDPATGVIDEREWYPDEMSEADFREFAELTGAEYPDRYMPEETRKQLEAGKETK